MPRIEYNNNISRLGKRWTVNETLQLQREFELLQLSVREIAIRHKRTPNAIMYKLDQEGLADYNVLYSNCMKLNNQMSTKKTNKYDDAEDVVSELSQEEEDEEEDEEEEDDDDECSEEEEEDDNDRSNLKNHVLRLEKQVLALTELLFSKQLNNKSMFSSEW